MDTQKQNVIIQWTGEHNSLRKAPTVGQPPLNLPTVGALSERGCIILTFKIRGGEEGL